MKNKNIFQLSFNKLYWLAAGLIFLLMALRAWCIPFSHDETATFFYYIQSGNYLPYKAHVYTNNHVLNSALSHCFYSLFGSHPFVLRLPNLLAFGLLVWGIQRHFVFLKNRGAKLILSSLFLLTFNFLDVFELCRGYGLSMAFMVWALSYLLHYFKTHDFKQLIYFTIGLHLALAANLTLLPTIVLLSGVLIGFQCIHRLFLATQNLGLFTLHHLLIGFWLKFTLFYKAQGMLDAGSPINYWKTTFSSLIEFIFGSSIPLLQITCIVAALIIPILVFYAFRKNPLNLKTSFTPLTVYAFTFFGLVLSFWLLNKLGGVNFPEDRTALFFYLFFVLAFSFACDVLAFKLSLTLSIIIGLSTLTSFVSSYNTRYFSSFFYHTMPTQLFDYLINEQAKSTAPLTIGGSKARELNYAFLNFRKGGVLNPMNVDESIQLHNDYNFALAIEKPYYEPFYEEVMRDEKWNRVLLKRKVPLVRKPLLKIDTLTTIATPNEFKNLLQLRDSAIASLNLTADAPLEVEFELYFEKVPTPFNAFLVFSFNDETNTQYDYRRIPLNWIGTNLNGKTQTFKLTSTHLPKKISELAVYIWNIEQANYSITCKRLQLYQLNGKGINLKVPDSFYPLMGKTNGQIQL